MTEHELKEGGQILVAEFRGRAYGPRFMIRPPELGRIVRLTKTQFRIQLERDPEKVVGPFRRERNRGPSPCPYPEKSRTGGWRAYGMADRDAVEQLYEEHQSQIAEREAEGERRRADWEAARQLKLSAAREQLGGSLESVIEWDCKSTYAPDRIEPEARTVRRVLLHLPNDLAVLISLEHRRQPNFRTGEWEDRVHARYSYLGARSTGASGTGIDGPDEESVLWDLVADLLDEKQY